MIAHIVHIFCRCCCCLQLSYIYERVFYGQNIIFYLAPYDTTAVTLVGGTYAYNFVTINCKVNASMMIGKQNGFLETTMSIEMSIEGRKKSNNMYVLFDGIFCINWNANNLECNMDISNKSLDFVRTVSSVVQRQWRMKKIIKFRSKWTNSRTWNFTLLRNKDRKLFELDESLLNTFKRFLY